MNTDITAGLAPAAPQNDQAPFAFTIAYIGIGANLGDARANVLDALERLQRQPGCTLMAHRACTAPRRSTPAATTTSTPSPASPPRWTRKRCCRRCKRSSRRTAANGPIATRRARST
jgi:hypothetical protein